MRREQRNNRVRFHGGRPPPGGVSGRWATNGADGGPSPAGPGHPGYAGVPGGETEEVARARTPPPRYRSLLVPLEGSPFGEHALPPALGTARRAGANVRLVHVHSPLE